MVRFRPEPVTVRELGLYFRHRTISEADGQPAPWDRLLAELRDGGYLPAGSDLGRLLHSGVDPVLAVAVPADAVRRIFATAGHRRYEARKGYLQWWGGRVTPLSAEEAFLRYGFELVAAVDGGQGNRAPVPGQRWRRAIARASLAGKVLLGVPAGAAMAAVAAAAGVAVLPLLAGKAARAWLPRRGGRARPVLVAPLWQDVLAGLAHELGIDEGEIRRSYSGGSWIGELEIVAVRDGERGDVLRAVSHDIFRKGYQVRSRPRSRPMRFAPGAGEFPQIEFALAAAGEALPGSAEVLREGQVGLHFVVRIPVAAQRAGQPEDAAGAQPPRKRTRTNRDLEAAALFTAFTAVPGFAVLAWFAVQALAPVHGTARVWVSVLASILFGSISFWAWFLLLFGLGMDASPHHDEVPRTQIGAFVKFLRTWLAVMTMWNAIAALAAGVVLAVATSLLGSRHKQLHIAHPEGWRERPCEAPATISVIRASRF